MESLLSGKYYHIYNRGNNCEDLFRAPDNYRHFLRLYEKYIIPIADTFAWVLMKNHFHLLVRIKEEGEIKVDELPVPARSPNPARVQNSGRVEIPVKMKQPHLYFSDLQKKSDAHKMVNRCAGKYKRMLRKL